MLSNPASEATPYVASRVYGWCTTTTTVTLNSLLMRERFEVGQFVYPVLKLTSCIVIEYRMVYYSHYYLEFCYTHIMRLQITPIH